MLCGIYLLTQSLRCKFRHPCSSVDRWQRHSVQKLSNFVIGQWTMRTMWGNEFSSLGNKTLSLHINFSERLSLPMLLMQEITFGCSWDVSDSNVFSCVKLQPLTFQWDLTLWTAVHIKRFVHQWCYLGAYSSCPST